MKSINFCLPIVFAAISGHLSAQYIGIHQEQSNYYSQFNYPTEADYDVLSPAPKVLQTQPALNKMQVCPLAYAVYGWNPYWIGTAYTNYDFSLLSTFCYFSYGLNPSTGSYSTIYSWKTTPSIDLAQAAGVRVELCVTNFGSANNTTFLTNAGAQQTLIDSLISLLNYRGADGVNIDFEGVPGSQRNNLTAFMINLSNQLKAAIPGASVTMAVYSVDWSNVFDIPALDPVVDQFIIMGYGYYYSGSGKAGPTAEFYKGTIWSNYNIVRSVNYYLNQGVTPSKLLLGLPYYGYEWQTVDNSVPSNTVAAIGSRTYTYTRTNYDGVYPKNWDPEGFNPYYTYQSGGNWRQAWVDDAYSLGKRYDLVKQKGIGGIGIWALGYDNGYNDLWNLLYEKFTTCGTVPCSDTIFDTGGPYGDHYDKENYSFTIAPTNASSISLTFNSFTLEPGYDSIWIYDGFTTADPLIGGYSGTTGPGLVTSSGAALTMKFFSDAAIVNSGWEAVWNCLTDTINPTTTINPANAWETADFTAVFTDADAGGSGLDRLFYQVSDFNGVEWRANNGNGFFNDNFDAVIHADWTDSTGVWAINSAYLNQSDENQGNSNIFASLAQNNTEVYLYNWQANMQSGSSVNKRQGLHFFSDNASLPNRGNSYFVFFREENNKVQIYKVVNDIFTLMSDNVISINADTWYDCKVIFNPASGEIKAYMNNVLVASWIDPSPFISGNYLSFRTGNANTLFNNLKVGKARIGTEVVTVGPGSANDVRYQNPNPSTPSCKINSIVKDAAENWSATASLNVNIDWSSPIGGIVNDGTGIDLDTLCTLTELSANWLGITDTNSGVVKYSYAIGTTPGGANVVPWVDNGLNSAVTHTGLALAQGSTYYFTIKAENGAGLVSNDISSDGQTPGSPAVSFSADTTQLTLPDSTVIFTDATPGATTWNWSFAGGSPGFSIAPSQTVYYNTAGTYNVSLTVTDIYGCTGNLTLPSYIIVSDPLGSAPIAGFNSNAVAGCVPLTINFFNASANNPDSLQWTFPGGDITSSTDGNPTITYSSPGTYPVTLSAFNQWGSDTVTYSAYITVYPIPTAVISGANSICTGGSTVLTASGGSTYSWSTGQTAASIAVAPAVATTYYVNVTSNGCVSAPAAFDVLVISVPTGSITPEQIVCKGDTVTLLATGGDTYLWSTGDTNSSIIVVGDSGIAPYSVIVFKTSCIETDTLTTTVTGLVPPTAGFAATDTLVYISSATVTFVNYSVNASSYFWDFGNGNTSFDKNPWNEYSDTGYYSVLLVSENGVCANDTLLKTAYLLVLPDSVNTGIIKNSDGTQDHILISPNPFTENIAVSFILNEKAAVQITLFDLYGKEILRLFDRSSPSGFINVPVELSSLDLSGGVYLLTVKRGVSSDHFRIIRW